MMEQLKKLEAFLDDFFLRQFPYQLPRQIKKNIAEALWAAVLAVGILQFWSAWELWRAGERANELVDAANYLSRVYGSGETAVGLGFFFYLSLTWLIAQTVLLLFAVPGLKNMSKPHGWDIVFYVVVFNVLYGAVRVFSDIEGGFLNFLWAVLVSGAAAYILFQVREYFGTTKSASHGVKVEKTTDKTVGGGEA